MNAILYAAGRATRLGREHALRPKILLEFGGRMLLEWHVIRLVKIGVRSIFVVTGYERLQIQAALPPLRERHGVELRELYNPDFCEGSVLSMMVSLPEIQKTTSNILLMDGDVLYDARMLPALVQSQHRTALLIDRSYSTADDDPVLVPMRGGKPFDFVKRWQGQADQVGESVGFFKLDAEDVPLLVTETCARLAGAGRLDSLDDVLRVLVKRGRFGAEDVTGMAWTEIDFPHDVEFALSQILPRLQQQEREMAATGGPRH
jgi:choline kinase